MNGSSGRVASDTWLLLTLRWQLGLNNFKSRKASRQVLTVLGFAFMGLVFGVTSGFVGVGAGLILREFPGSGVESLLPGLILTGVALLVLASSFGIALGSLFLSSDLELLMTAPVETRAVFIAKLLDGMTYFYALTAVTALPGLITYGIGIGYGPLYYIFAVLAVIGVPLFPAGLAALLVMVVARFAPARRVREVIGLVGALFGMSCALLGQLPRFWAPALGNARSAGSAEEFARTFQGIANLPIPSIVAGKGLAEAGAGDIGPALVNLSGFFLLTFGFFALTVLAAERLYASGWVRMQSSGSSKRSARRVERAARSGGLLSTAPAYLALALKDWRVIPRDLRNFAQFLSPLLLLPIIYINLLGSRSNGGDLTNVFGGENVDFTGPFIAVGVLIATALVFGRIAATSISMEGKSWWLLRAAPITPWELMRGKLLAATVPFVVLSTLLLAGTALWKHFSLAGFFYGWYGVELLGLCLMCVEVGLSAPWAKLDWDDPRRMGSGLGEILSLAIWAVTSIVAGLLLFVPIFSRIFIPEYVLLLSIAGVALATALVAGVSWLVLNFGASRVAAVGDAS